MIEKIEITAPFLETIRDAGKAIMRIYGSPFSVEQKSDLSPVTAADRLSHDIVAAYLRSTYGLPVLSEEGKHSSYAERKNWNAFWLVDPLDGTKEFISRNGEFTVNVALIDEHTPVLGAIYLPAKDLLYYAVKGKGAYKVVNDQIQRLPHSEQRRGVKVVGSRSHGSIEFNEYVRKLRARHQDVEIVPAGSSLKFCLVAEGSADLYPRLGPTMEWDTAAGQMIVEEAGGRVVEAVSRQTLKYNKAELKNPNFIAIGRSFHGDE